MRNYIFFWQQIGDYFLIYSFISDFIWEENFYDNLEKLYV